VRELAKPRLLTIVVNPASGGGRAGRVLPRVAQHLRETLPTTELHVIQSTSWEHARDHLRAAAISAREGDSVVAMGGDGMAHLGLNACAHTEATLGIIPAGTGNDFARAVGVPKDVFDAVDLIAAGRWQRMDLSHVSNSVGERYVGAVVSSGYDARVNRATNETHLRFGSLSYGMIALKELAGFSPLQYRLVIDGAERQMEAMLVAVCNTGVVGGGMRFAPDADFTDGVLDLTIIHPVGRGRLLRLLPSVYSGKFVSDPSVERLRATEVGVDGEDMFLMGDGEELGDVPATIRCDAGALKVYCP
jgi:diacylglycerol kinase (ATP)